MYVFNLNQVIFSISVRRTMLVEMRRRYLIEAFNVKMKKKSTMILVFFTNCIKSEVNSPLDKITLVFRG